MGFAPSQLHPIGIRDLRRPGAIDRCTPRILKTAGQTARPLRHDDRRSPSAGSGLDAVRNPSAGATPLDAGGARSDCTTHVHRRDSSHGRQQPRRWLAGHPFDWGEASGRQASASAISRLPRMWGSRRSPALGLPAANGADVSSDNAPRKSPRSARPRGTRRLPGHCLASQSALWPRPRSRP